MQDEQQKVMQYYAENYYSYQQLDDDFYGTEVQQEPLSAGTL